MQVVMTGAAGRVGTAVHEHLGNRDEYEFSNLDIAEHSDIVIEHTDMTDYDDLRSAFEGKDAAIHLGFVRDSAVSAFNRSVAWSEPFRDNLEAISNVVEAAIEEGLDRVVFASSNHAVGMYEVEHAPRIYDSDFDLEIDHTVTPRPDSMYGVTKVFGEAIGRLAAEAHGLRFYALRIGAVREAQYDHPYGDAERGVDEGRWERGSDEYQEQVRRMKAMWQSRRDLAQLVDRCLQDDTVTYDVFYGWSDGSGRWVDLDHPKAVLGYEPLDNADDWSAPPS